MSLGFPLILLLPAIILATWLWRHKVSQAAIYPDTSELATVPQSLKLALRTPLFLILTCALVLMLGIAGSDPRQVTQIREDYKSRNIMIAMDLSRSMSFLDFASSSGLLSRISAVKDVTREFIDSRGQDRIGLVVFGSAAYLQSPLTLDHELLREMIERLEVGIAGDATAIGDGLGIALKRIADVPSPSKAIILITDGVSNSGQVSPLKAAHVAKDLGVKIHTIGVGGGLHLDYDEHTLREIADLTGGVYFNAEDYAGLKSVYAEIDKLEQSKTREPNKVHVEHYFAPFAVAAMILYLLYLLLFQTILMKTP